ncbi:MAG: hypothetical protein FJX59_06150 [Alphaproteobacteria bacterium]|nr:hypothetical protein [Alphaproteobacteria bacterium]
MRILTVVVLVAVAGCAGGGRSGLTNMFCGMREEACMQRCEAMDASAQIECRRSCSDNAADKCG